MSFMPEANKTKSVLEKSLDESLKDQKIWPVALSPKDLNSCLQISIINKAKKALGTTPVTAEDTKKRAP